MDVALVSYRGAGPALNDLMGGQIDGVCDAATSLSGAVQGEKVKALVVATPARLASLPSVPTSAEAGLPAFQAQGWNAIFVPKNTPEPVIATLNAALRTALASPDRCGTGSRICPRSFPRPSEMTPAFVAQLVPAEIEKYRVLLQRQVGAALSRLRDAGNRTASGLSLAMSRAGRRGDIRCSARPS